MKTNYGEVDERQDGFFCMRILWRVDFECEERPWALLVLQFPGDGTCEDTVVSLCNNQRNTTSY